MINNDILGVVWYTAITCIGIVVVKPFHPIEEDGEYVAYIATVEGNNENQDMYFIRSFGVKFDLRNAMEIIKSCGEIFDLEEWKKAEDYCARLQSQTT